MIVNVQSGQIGENKKNGEIQKERIKINKFQTISVYNIHVKEHDKSSDIERQPPFSDIK